MAHGGRDPISRLQPLLQVVILAFALFCLGIAQDVFIPIALAMLLTFVLSPIVERLQRWHLPRVVAVVVTVACAFSVLGGLGWLLASQISSRTTLQPQRRRLAAGAAHHAGVLDMALGPHRPSSSAPRSPCAWWRWAGTCRRWNSSSCSSATSRW